MPSFKTVILATLLSAVIATPLQERALDNVSFDIAPSIESRGEASTSGNGGNGGNCDYNEKNRLDVEINNRYRLKAQLDTEIDRRQDIKAQLERDISKMKNCRA
ncbi:uncharacterized protein CTRU02_201212 [Colletotrichum truncatum]|uniref:Uncharacterized protein n=1 Tax=Colletotrichum truncatum TaxID=5467 RepID=A0ACC3ZGV4_COLTU|nr:uncharacterized protein CTRU02_07999 [Colletotrichum truncatum]KAF6790479.1 hypothetical protein CTRU02_07999 [Colletotrichum truncatum]